MAARFSLLRQTRYMWTSLTTTLMTRTWSIVGISSLEWVVSWTVPSSQLISLSLSFLPWSCKRMWPTVSVWQCSTFCSLLRRTLLKWWLPLRPFLPLKARLPSAPPQAPTSRPSSPSLSLIGFQTIQTSSIESGLMSRLLNQIHFWSRVGGSLQIQPSSQPFLLLIKSSWKLLMQP